MTITAHYLTGRLANGAERDCGTLWHAVSDDSYSALCGARPGRRSGGWGPFEPKELQDPNQPITCPRCLKKMQKAQAASIAERWVKPDVLLAELAEARGA